MNIRKQFVPNCTTRAERKVILKITLMEIVVMVDTLTQTYLVCDSETLSTESVN